MYLVQVCSPGPPAFVAGGRLTFSPLRARQYTEEQADLEARLCPSYAKIPLAEALQRGPTPDCKRSIWAEGAAVNHSVWFLSQNGSEWIREEKSIFERPVDLAICRNESLALRWNDAWAVAIYNVDDGGIPIYTGIYEDQDGHEYDISVMKISFDDGGVVWAFTITTQARLYYLQRDMAVGTLDPRA
jgi:hypothetical protein